MIQWCNTHQLSKLVSWEAHCSPINFMHVHCSVLWDLTFDLLVVVTWTGAKSWTQVVSWAPWGHIIAVSYCCLFVTWASKTHFLKTKCKHGLCICKWIFHDPQLLKKHGTIGQPGFSRHLTSIYIRLLSWHLIGS